MTFRLKRNRLVSADNKGTIFVYDALGSTIALTDPSGNSQVQYSYDPYGNMSATGSTTNSYTYTGREFDGIGLYYYRARYYDPATGRLISEDPIGFAGGINKYAYAGNDPIDYFDPFGTDENAPISSCNALTAALAQAVTQITDSGEAVELLGLELSELSFASIAFGPEGILVAGGGIDMGVSMMELGAQVAAVGEGLETYVRTGNALTAGAAAGADAFANAAISALVKEALPGAANFFQSAIVTVLGAIPGMIAEKENACGGS